MLEVEGIVSGYGPIEVLHQVSISVAAGEVVAVLGANGAGKTTLLNTIVGLVPATAGTLRYRGVPVGSPRPEVLAREGLVLVPEGRRVFAPLSVEENLLLGGRLSRETIPDRLTEVFGLFPRLHERLTQRAGTLSGGEQQMLAIGRALMADPQLILLDEPSLGLSPKFTGVIFDAIANLAQRGRTLVLVEQNAFMAARVSDRTYVLGNGRVVAEGSAEDFADVDSIKAAYLGGGA